MAVDVVVIVDYFFSECFFLSLYFVIMQQRFPVKFTVSSCNHGHVCFVASVCS